MTSVRRGYVFAWLSVLAVVGMVVATWWGARAAAESSTALVAAPWDADAPGWLGADDLGRDVVARTLAGGFAIVSQSLVIGPATTLIGLILAVLATGKPRLTRLAIAVSSLMLAVPAMVIVIVLTAWTPASVAVAVVMLLAGVPFTVRVLLPVLNDTATWPFVETARTRGDGHLLVMLRDVVPALSSTIVSDAVTRTVVTVHLLAAVHVLGRGPVAPQADWGVMIRENLPGVTLNPASVIAPAACLVAWCVALSALADRVGAVLAVDRSLGGERRGWLRRVSPGDGSIRVRGTRLVQDGEVVVDVPSFVAEPGRVTAVVGPTGCGKSTLVSVCAGLTRPGLEVLPLPGSESVMEGAPTTRRARRAVLGWVDQDPIRTFAPRDSVVATVRDGRRSVSGEACERALSRVGLARETWDRHSGKVSGGQAVRIAVARAVVGGPRLLVLDEPTAGLDESAVGAVEDVVREAADGCAVIVVSHDLDLVRRVADSVYTVTDRTLRQVELTADDGDARGAPVEQRTDRLENAASSASGLVVRDLELKFGPETVCEPVSFAAEPGQLVAVTGPSGSGKSTLLRALAGVHPSCGQVTWKGSASTAGAGVPGAMWVPQDSARALPPMASVRSLAARYAPGSRAERRASGDAALAALGVDERVWGRRPGEVSGGQRQRTAVAQAVASGAEVLLVDEPTSAVDEATAARVIQALRERAEAGAIVIVATHDPALTSQSQIVVTCERLRAS